MTPIEIYIYNITIKLQKEMLEASKKLEFEKAIELRNKIEELKKRFKR